MQLIGCTSTPSSRWESRITQLAPMRTPAPSAPRLREPPDVDHAVFAGGDDAAHIEAAGVHQRHPGRHQRLGLAVLITALQSCQLRPGR